MSSELQAVMERQRDRLAVSSTNFDDDGYDFDSYNIAITPVPTVFADQTLLRPIVTDEVPNMRSIDTVSTGTSHMQTNMPDDAARRIGGDFESEHKLINKIQQKTFDGFCDIDETKNSDGNDRRDSINKHYSLDVENKDIEYPSECCAKSQQKNCERLSSPRTVITKDQIDSKVENEVDHCTSLLNELNMKEVSSQENSVEKRDGAPSKITQKTFNQTPKISRRESASCSNVASSKSSRLSFLSRKENTCTNVNKNNSSIRGKKYDANRRRSTGTCTISKGSKEKFKTTGMQKLRFKEHHKEKEEISNASKTVPTFKTPKFISKKRRQVTNTVTPNLKSSTSLKITRKIPSPSLPLISKTSQSVTHNKTKNGPLSTVKKYSACLSSPVTKKSKCAMNVITPAAKRTLPKMIKKANSLLLPPQLPQNKNKTFRSSKPPTVKWAKSEQIGRAKESLAPSSSSSKPTLNSLVKKYTKSSFLRTRASSTVGSSLRKKKKISRAIGKENTALPSLVMCLSPLIEAKILCNATATATNRHHVCSNKRLKPNVEEKFIPTISLDSIVDDLTTFAGSQSPLAHNRGRISYRKMADIIITALMERDSNGLRAMTCSHNDTSIVEVYDAKSESNTDDKCYQVQKEVVWHCSSSKRGMCHTVCASGIVRMKLDRSVIWIENYKIKKSGQFF